MTTSAFGAFVGCCAFFDLCLLGSSQILSEIPQSFLLSSTLRSSSAGVPDCSSNRAALAEHGRR
ncbi:hypothetical protein ACPOL_4528 [Acidisarcina polymorpha]|uniref:Uncharacterized protein n=1 Tax=Acidisarcina polymorpha TaxID=2211140 RepID=A0A2Z5G450_9BACT|nr:hypothetical protein ACPOL_4528 [Acidisarcina polymorpha]